MRHLLLVGALLICAACGTKTASDSFTRDVRYFWEPKAGLCFAAIESWSSQGFAITSIAHVPDRACGKESKP